MSSVSQTPTSVQSVMRFFQEKQLLVGSFFTINLLCLVALILFSPGADFQQLKSGGFSGFKLAVVALLAMGVLFESILWFSGSKVAAYFPYSFAVSLMGFAWIYFPKLPRIALYPDSHGYIHNDPIRGFMLPAFLDLLIPQSVQDIPWPVSAEEFLRLSSHYSIVAYAQWFLFIAVVFLLMRLLHKRFFLGPLILFGLVAGHQFFFPKAFLTGNVAAHLSFVLTEGLGYVWVLGLAYYSFWMSYKSKLPLLPALLLGLYCYLGIEIAPRLIPFAIMGIIIPVVLAFFNSQWASKIRRVTPALVFTLFFLIRCSYNFAHFDVFAFTPFGGFTTSGISLQFASSEDYKLVKDPFAREFAYRALHHKSRSPVAYKNLFVNNNIYGVGYGTYQELAKEQNRKTDIASYNAVVSPVTSAIFFKNPAALKRWAEWFTTQLRDLWNERAYFTPVHFLAIIFSVLLIFLTRGKNLIFRIGPFLLLLPLASLCLTVGIQGVDFRYLSTGELLFPVVISVLAVESIRLVLGERFRDAQ